MVVVILSKVPPKLKGHIAKILFTMPQNVFIGNVSAKVRDNLWGKIEEFLDNGKAIMIYDTDTEQGYSIRCINKDWQIKDYDGLQIMKKIKGKEGN